MKKRKKLIWRIYPSFLLVTILSVAAVSWYASGSLRHFYYEQTEADLLARGRILSRQIVELLQPLDPDALDALCKDTGRASGTRITVLSESGQVIGDSDRDPKRMENHAGRPEVISAFSGRVGSAIRFSDTLHKKMMYVAVPIMGDRSVSAILRTSISVSSIDRDVRSLQMRIALAGVLIAAVVAGISLYISRMLSRPLVEMKKGAVEFAGGNLRHRLPSPPSRELSELTEALNRMAAQLDERIRTIVRQRNELETVLTSMDEGVIAIDTGERILNMNRAAFDIFRLNAGDIKGKMIQEVVRNNELLQSIIQALSGGTAVEKDITLYQNRERILNVHTLPLKGADQEPIGILTVLKDVTQIRRLETMRRDFVANVSHEIKTPLTAIKGYVETLRSGAVDNSEESKRFLGIIEKHVDRLSSIIDDLLKLSKIEMEDENRKFALEEHPLKGILLSAIQVCQSKADAKNIRISLQCEDGLRANVDPHLIEQAAVNLLDNAIKYSDREGSVQVEVRSDTSEILIGFKDRGIGIAREHLPRLFERFYRVDKARSRKAGGTGLGLSIVKHIAHAHGGAVTVESTPGKGSTFSLHLPKS
jgi:two-component system phosphate regulon sensor histidine kinase PhoR